MSSNDCSNCDKLSVIITDQKHKMQLIETRMKDLIRAYKSMTTERDNLLAISSSAVLPLNNCDEQQKRLSILESSVAEMSAICGKYESERIKDKQLIEQLTQKCEQLTIDLETSKSLNSSNEAVKQHSEQKDHKVRHRGIQTEEFVDENVSQTESTSDQKPIEIYESFVYAVDVETQTDSGLDFDNLSTNKSKKSELAIVVPTQRDSMESEQLSNTSYSPSPPNSADVIERYPVFSSNPRDMTNSSETLFSNNSSHGVSLFYANELARKEIDLAEIRLQAREYECALRELQWKYNMDKYKLQSRITDLERHQSMVSSNQSMSQLNITYIRNVLTKLLNTKDKQQKQFMINAIMAALEPKDRKPK